MSIQIKVFLKKCRCEKNQKLFQLLNDNLHIIINNGTLEFFPLDIKQIKTIKHVTSESFPMFIINKKKIEGLKKIRDVIDGMNKPKQNFHIIKRNNDEMNLDTNKLEKINNIKKGNFLFDDDDDKNRDEVIQKNLNQDLKRRNINISNKKSVGVNMNNENNDNQNVASPKNNKNKNLNTSRGSLEKAMNKAPPVDIQNTQYDNMLDNLLDNIQETNINYVED